MTLYMKFVSLRPKFIISFMIGVDLFSGAGGLSLGAEMAGVNIKYAVEYDLSLIHISEPTRPY